MIHQHRINRFLFVLFTVIYSMQSFAGVEPYQNQLKGTIKKGDSLIVKDEKFRNILFNWDEITNRTVKNFISLQITQDTPVVLKKAFTCEVDLKVEYYSTPDQAEPVSINSVKLKVNYSPESGVTYKAKDVYSFSNGYLVKITVNNISSPELGDSIPPVLQLTNQVVIDRQYVYHPEKNIEFSGNISPASPTSGNNKMMALSVSAGNLNNNFLSLTWPAISGAEEYDIEWAVFDQGTEKQPVINQVLGGQALGADVLDGLFRNNSTRITTPEQNYDITMAYNATYIMVRMRQVHYTNGYRDEDDWDYNINGTSQYAIWTIPSWHEQNLNWQYAATFAEDGKKKEVISYFDGSLRSRQQVTINNSDQVAVVQETVYDEFGRAAANILPAPTDDNTFHYYPNFNLNQNNSASYDYRNLRGTIGVFCENTPEPLGNGNGATKYYSEANPFLNVNNAHYRKYNQYIPHANGYPLSVTQYVNDNTGRVRLQGAVGSLFQPGKTDRHVTKYYYGKPEQYELDRLFGNDVGYAYHYLKNLTVDVNGQINISYINAHGKTIATALTGEAPGGMDALASKPDPEDKTFTILRPSQFTFDATSLSLNAKTTYLASVAGANAQFSYDIQKLIYTYHGSTFQVCSNCYYDLTIRVSNDCGQPLFTNTVPVGSLAADCNNTGTHTGFFGLTFDQIGEYQISFEYKLSNDVIDQYTDKYITQRQQNGDMRTEMDFVLDYLKSSDFTGCFNECTTCEQALGTQAQFSAAIKGKLTGDSVDQSGRQTELDTWISGLYNALHTQCIALRATCMVSSCSKYEQAMLDDVTPGGQYALFSYDPFMPLEQDINVIYLHWREVFPIEDPGSPDYEAEAVYDENGNKTSPYDGNFTVEMLVKYWKDDWAKKFLQYHPEKCKLDFCNTNSDYIMWDDQVQQLINKASDIPNIPRTSGLQYSYSNGAWLMAGDPFFQLGAPGYSVYFDMLNDLNMYSSRIMGVSYSGASVKGLTQVIDYLMYCADIDGSTNSGPASDNWNNCSPVASCRVPDKEWSQYKDMYFQLKQKYYQIVRSNTSCANMCSVGTPYSVPGSCATINDFTVERVTGVSCDAGYQAVRISYAKGAAFKPMTVNLYYPLEYALLAKPTSVQFAIGESDRIICVPNSVQVSSIKIRNVTCTGNANPTCITGGISDQLVLVGGTQQLSANKFQMVYNTGLVTTYTIVPGRPDQPPADGTYCDGGTVTRKNFYNCFKVFMPGSSIPVQYFNVWVIGCNKDLCANPPTYYVEYQLDTYKFYENGQYYYVKLQSGEGATPECATTPNYQPCVKFIVNDNPNPLVFLNATVNTCDACPDGGVHMIKTGIISSSNPDVYPDESGTFNIIVYPNTTPYTTPPNIPCSNYTTEWHSCVNVWGHWGSKTYLNATVVTCGSNNPCDYAPEYYMDGGSGGYYWSSTPDYTEQVNIFPGSDPNNPPYTGSYCSNTDDVSLDWYDCVKYNAYGVSTSYQNAWVITCFHYSWARNKVKQNDSSLVKSDRIVPQPANRTDSTSKWQLRPGNVVAFNYSRAGSQTGTNGYRQLNNLWVASPCPEAYAYKKARFPEFNYTYSTAAQDLQGMQDESNQLIASQIQTNCEAQADKWMQQLDACLVLYPNQKAALRAKLLEVCVNGGDVDHPYGASTLPPGATGTTSFKQAILSVLGLSAPTMICNPWLLDEPHPYSPKQQSVSKTLGNTNADLCTRLAQLRTDAGSADLYTYLVNKYGAAMNLTSPQLDMLVKSCNNCRYILEQDIPLPVFMEPGATGCITQADYNAAKTALAADMGGNLDVNHANYPDVLTNYLNDRWGFSMAYYRYQEYETSLQSNSSAILCNNPPYTDVPVDQYTCLKQVVGAAIVSGRHDYDQYLAEEKRIFKLNYVNTCGQAQAQTQLTTRQQTYHYTLYYYDLAGNLVRTVQPEGVRFLTDQEVGLVDDFRKVNTVVDCSGFGMPATENKTVALNAFSSALQSNSVKSFELWLNNTSGSNTRYVRFVTPDNKYFYQASIKNGKLWVELYTLQPGTNGDIAITLSNTTVADVSGITIQPWSHLFMQGNNFTGSPWDLFLDGRRLTVIPDPSGLPYPFEWEIDAGYTLPTEDVSQLKHLRIYDRFATDAEILANYGNQCQAPEAALSIKSSPLILWARLNLPSSCNNSTNTRTVGNRGALQASGAISNSTTNVFNDISNNFTVEMWVNPQEAHEIDAESQTGTAGATGQKYVIYPTSGGSTGNAGMGISVGTNGVSVYEQADNYFAPLLVWQGAVTAWTHIAVVYTNKTPVLYINGSPVHTGLTSTKTGVSPSYNICSGSNGTMKGSIDELRIWNIARAQANINADYRSSISPASAGLVAYWPLSREDGADLYDVSCTHLPVHISSNYFWTTTTAPVADVVPLEYSVQGIFPRHRLTSSSAYNSSDKVVQKNSPDGGLSYFWYDQLGRVIASQTEEQRTPHDNINPNRYTYTAYEPTLGRVLEVGEKSNGQALPTPGFLDQTTINAFLASGTNGQITQNLYDKVPAAGSGVQTGLLQDNLRKRISAAFYKETATGPVLQASYYSYDLLGNVKTLWQQVDGLALKRIDYEYDLVSDKTNFVRYQDGQNDQFYYAYTYDAENRLIESYSGTQALISPRGSTLLNGQLDAFEQYYLHGSLARTELGQNKVQGLDYAYTLQGWMRGINGHQLNASTEMGNDGNSAANPIAKDVMALTWGFYQGDYQAIGGTNANAFPMQYLSAGGDITGNSLYNGNISHTTVALSQIRNGDPVGYTYHYDQLNRIKEMRYHPLSASTTSWNNSTRASDDAYKESITYDENGNILTYVRNGANTAGNPLAMDALTYQYAKQTDPVNNRDYLTSNQLQQVKDAVAQSNYSLPANGTIDIDDQANSDNYRYDKTGNLVADLGSNITNINWTIFGKISSLTKNDAGTITTITYAYDALGNRVRKVVSMNASSTVTWYVRDAQGTELAIYGDQQNGQSGTWWQEQHLFGSRRLGMWSPGVNIAVAAGTGQWGILGKKSYELTNLTGNVIAVITDKKIGVTSGGSGIDHYEAEITAMQDYFVYGMLMPGRTLNPGSYGYGFNGQEKSNEINADGNIYTALFWEYDTRIGRRWNLDPKPTTGWSEYSAFSASPVWMSDLLGDSSAPIKPFPNINERKHGLSLTYGGTSYQSLDKSGITFRNSEENYRENWPSARKLFSFPALDEPAATLSLEYKFNTHRGHTYYAGFMWDHTKPNLFAGRIFLGDAYTLVGVKFGREQVALSYKNMRLSLIASVGFGPMFSKPKADGDGGPSLKGFNGKYQIAGVGMTSTLGAAIKITNFMSVFVSYQVHMSQTKSLHTADTGEGPGTTNMLAGSGALGLKLDLSFKKN